MRKYTLLFLTLALLTPLFIIGCDVATEPFLPLVNNEMRATISDFGGFDVQGVETSASGNGYFSVKGRYKGTNGDSLVITLFIPKQATAPYSITVQNDDVALIDYCVQQTSGVCTNFDAKKGQGSGTIKVSSLTSDGVNQTMEGIFSGTVTSTSGGGSKTISNGSFKVQF